MIAVQHVVCPVDFSDASRRALECAAVISRWYEARLTVLHVFADVPVIDAVPKLKGQALALQAVNATDLRAALSEFVGTVHCEVPTTVQVSEASDPHTGIVKEIEALNPDLLVMGTHGRTGFQRLVLGSVTERVLHSAPCPVLTVPPQARFSGQGTPFRRIVVAVDFSATSVRALRMALDLAEEADADITLLHVIELPPELHDPAAAGAADMGPIRAAAEAAALQRLRDLVPSQVRTYCTVHTAAVEGRAHREILREAQAREADLIVMGVRGANALDRLIFGSNAHSVLIGARCPVLTVV